MDETLEQSEHRPEADANPPDPPWKEPHPRLAYAVTKDGHQLLCHRPKGSVIWDWAFRALGDGNPSRDITKSGRTWELDRARALCEDALFAERERLARHGR